MNYVFQIKVAKTVISLHIYVSCNEEKYLGLYKNITTKIFSLAVIGVIDYYSRIFKNTNRLRKNTNRNFSPTRFRNIFKDFFFNQLKSTIAEIFNGRLLGF
ncbi:hypothetical protein LEP1GSC050_1834 [Leptospira broomii serovar Hurstbridge str. 5399]|uniref:Uncharacterized protein n=1 Tax=Leptospira broomii serovar Hurstbridge str. 5399 TaxID=1049789 RepID=T0GAB8_9LEPT|nr:hypothetical protein LEP1GSC050_1834 [Leptospira broomii serovar Hurstbridge str. 5399]